MLCSHQVVTLELNVRKSLGLKYTYQPEPRFLGVPLAQCAGAHANFSACHMNTALSVTHRNKYCSACRLLYVNAETMMMVDIQGLSAGHIRLNSQYKIKQKLTSGEQKPCNRFRQNLAWMTMSGTPTHITTRRYMGGLGICHL